MLELRRSKILRLFPAPWGMSGRLAIPGKSTSSSTLKLDAEYMVAGNFVIRWLEERDRYNKFVHEPHFGFEISLTLLLKSDSSAKSGIDAIHAGISLISLCSIIMLRSDNRLN